MKRNSRYFFIYGVLVLFVLNTVTCLSTQAQPLSLQNSTQPFLPTEKAFILHPPEYNDGQIILHWTIAHGYYLYRDHISLIVSNHKKNKTHTLQGFNFPVAKTIQDPYLGELAVYEHHLELIIPLVLENNFEPDALVVQYQGCSIKGLCYPPVEQSFPLLKQSSFSHRAIPKEPSSPVLIEPTTTTMQFTYFDNASLTKTLFTFFGLGVLLSFTPCVLPMLPILSAIIVGEKKINTHKAFFLSLTYTLSMASVLALLGIIAVAFGKNLQVFFQHPISLSLFALLFFYLGLTQLGIGKLSLPSQWQQTLYQWQSRFPAGSYLNAFIMGSLATLIASPCVSPPLVAALSFITQTNHYFYGALALFCLGLGMGTVLLCAGTLGGRYLPRAGAWMHIVNKIFASLLFALSIWILSRILNARLSMGLWAIWCLLNAYWLGTFANLREMISRTTGVLFVLAASLIGLFAIQGEANPSQRFSFLWHPLSHSVQQKLVFTEINTLDELKQKLSSASARPTLLKVHANWCVSCQENEKVIFSNAEVHNALQNWQLLVLDLSEMTAAKQQLLEHFAVFGPPTLLFFNAHDHENVQERLVGKTNRAHFLEKLDELSATNLYTATLKGNFN